MKYLVIFLSLSVMWIYTIPRVEQECLETTFISCGKKNYPEQLLNKYKTELYKMSVISGNRKHYSNMVAIMRRMKKISGGTKIVGQITEEWREKYRNRPAMMDELNKQ